MNYVIPRRLRVPVAMLIGSVTLLTIAIARAADIEGVPGARTSSPSTPQPPFESPQAESAAFVFAALDRDPFHPQRRRPSERFRLAAATATASVGQGAPLTRNAPDQLDLVLVGTVVASDGPGFVMAYSGAEPPRVVRVGQRIGDHELLRVGRGRAVLRAPSGREIELRVPNSGG